MRTSCVVVALLIVAACAGSSPPPASPEPEPAADEAPPGPDLGPTSPPAGRYSDAGRAEFMTACVDEGGVEAGDEEYCRCVLTELERRHPEEYVDGGFLTEEQMNEAVAPCLQ